MEILPSGYGWVVLVGACTCVMLMWKAIRIAPLRKKLGIPYPTMEAVPGVTRRRMKGEKEENPQLLTDEECNLFNCYQRAHHNTLEMIPIFFVLLFVGGLRYPLACAALGALWVALRIIFAIGYSTGNPKNRFYGVTAFVPLGCLLATNIVFAMRLIQDKNF